MTIFPKKNLIFEKRGTFSSIKKFLHSNDLKVVTSKLSKFEKDCLRTVGDIFLMK